MQDTLEDEEDGPLEERIYSQKWKVRFSAFKEINKLFYNDFAKYDQVEDKSAVNVADLMGSFEYYGPKLQ